LPGFAAVFRLNTRPFSAAGAKPQLRRAIPAGRFGCIAEDSAIRLHRSRIIAEFPDVFESARKHWIPLAKSTKWEKIFGNLGNFGLFGA
jgi:hypothetical protein